MSTVQPTAPAAEWPRMHRLDLKHGDEVVPLVVPERTDGRWQVTRSPDPPR
jgi:hypothetical protein